MFPKIISFLPQKVYYRVEESLEEISAAKSVSVDEPDLTHHVDPNENLKNQLMLKMMMLAQKRWEV